MTTIETVEQAVNVLNERKWRGCEYAAGDRIVYWRDPAGSNQWHETLNSMDAIAIAQSLLDRDEIAELKQLLTKADERRTWLGRRNAQLRQQFECLRLAAQPFVERMRYALEIGSNEIVCLDDEMRTFIAAYDTKGER
jgi:hypothetical protein